MNRVVLVGRLTKDPELRTTKNGTSNVTFTLAVSRRTTNEEGEHETDFINCTAWRGLADTIAKYLKKGREVAIEGRIQTSSYDAPDGSKRYKVEVVADNMTFIGSKESQAGDKTQDIEKREIEDPFESMGEEFKTLDDDELPF